MHYRFGTCHLDTSNGVLLVDGTISSLRKQALALLSYLVAHHGRVVSKQELIDAVWDQEAVSDEALTRCVSDVRMAIGDNLHEVIKTIPRRGYLFASASLYPSTQGAVSARLFDTEQRHTGPEDGGTTIAVLPFSNLGGDGEYSYLADGLATELITELSRFSGLKVIARNSSFQYRGKQFDVRVVGRELGCHFVLEGSLYRTGADLRITMQLADTGTGLQVWADRFDARIEDLLALQKDLTQAIVGRLAINVSRVEAEMVLRKPPTDWRAYDWFLRASAVLARYWSTLKPEELYEARALAEAACAADPKFALPYALLSHTMHHAWIQPIDNDYISRPALDKSLELARKAVSLGPQMSETHAALAMPLCSIGQHHLALSAIDKAISLNPNFSEPRFPIALVFCGEHARAVALGEAHMRKDPFYSPGAAGWLAFGHVMLKQYEKALPLLQEFAMRAPQWRVPHMWSAICYGYMGDRKSAESAGRALLSIEPGWTIAKSMQVNVFRLSQDTEYFVGGLRRAGLPEGKQNAAQAAP